MATAVGKYIEESTAHNDRIDKAVDGLSADIAFVKAELERINNSPGSISAEDQASLDKSLARTKTIADKLEALDAQTAPTPPPVPPEGEPTPNP